MWPISLTIDHAGRTEFREAESIVRVRGRRTPDLLERGRVERAQHSADGRDESVFVEWKSGPPDAVMVAIGGLRQDSARHAFGRSDLAFPGFGVEVCRPVVGKAAEAVFFSPNVEVRSAPAPPIDRRAVQVVIPLVPQAGNAARPRQAPAGRAAEGLNRRIVLRMPRTPIFRRDFAGAEPGGWPNAESKKIRTAVSCSAAEAGRRTRQSPGAIPVLTKGRARSTAPTTLSRPRARPPNLGIGETDAEDECGSPGEDLRVPVRQV
jgi:hypothetical protein